MAEEEKLTGKVVAGWIAASVVFAVMIVLKWQGVTGTAESVVGMISSALAAFGFQLEAAGTKKVEKQSTTLLKAKEMELASAEKKTSP